MGKVKNHLVQIPLNLVIMATERLNLWKILKNDLLRKHMGKLELCRIVYIISLYKTCVFIAVAQVLWLLWQLKFSIDLHWVK